MAYVAVIAAVVGTLVSTMSQANALRSQAKARKIEGEQELLATKRQFRQELGRDVASVGASGLLGSSFENVFESQAILDSEFLGQIQQRTDFDVESLRRQANSTIVTGLISAVGKAAGGTSDIKNEQQRVEFARRERERARTERAGQRRVSGNIFSTGTGTSPGFVPRSSSTSLFF